MPQPNAATISLLDTQRAAGKSAAEAAAVLAADPRFALVVDRNEIRHLLSVHPTLLIRMQDMLGETLHSDPETNLRLRGGLARVLNTALWETGILELTATEYAVEYRALLDAFRLLGKLTEPEVQAFLDLGGGSLIEPLTAPEITAHWEWQDAQRQAAGLLDRAQAAAHARVTSIQSWALQAQSLRDELRIGATEQQAVLLEALEQVVQLLEG